MIIDDEMKLRGRGMRPFFQNRVMLQFVSQAETVSSSRTSNVNAKGTVHGKQRFG